MAKVMLVDDSKVSRRVVGDLVTALGHTVVLEVTSGEDAVEKYEAGIADCILMDVEMDGISGIEAAKLLTQKDPDAKIIIVSSVSEANRLKDAYANGAKGNVQKPVNKESLDQAINAVLG